MKNHATNRAVIIPAGGNRNNSSGAQNNLGSNGNYWSSGVSGTNAYNLNFNSSGVNPANTNNRANGFSVRCTQHSQQYKEFGGNSALLLDLFRAYFDARKNKRSTKNVLAFEEHYEEKLSILYEDIVRRQYKISRSICFIVDKPVKREIFAADFRDRIVHHLLFNWLNPIFEPHFIADSYSCRKGKGTLAGIRQLEHFIRSCSENYSKECWILKLDILGYFMSMDRNILYKKIERTVQEARRTDFNPDLALYLARLVIFNDPTKNFVAKSQHEDWVGLPKSKSLFFAGEGRGFPVGNLTSQLFSNIYLDDFDHFVREALGIKRYVRYVDDMVLVHADAEVFKALVSNINVYLQDNLGLTLHPKKIYLQEARHGVSFLGAFIKPWRTYVGRRTKRNFYACINEWNTVAKKEHDVREEVLRGFLASFNSYLGIVRHFNTVTLRRTIVSSVCRQIQEQIVWSSDVVKVSAKATTIALSLFLFAGIALMSPHVARAAYLSSGTVTSTNLLNSASATSITGFYYDLSSLPGDSSVTIQWSEDGSNWYSSAGVLNGSDTLSTTGGATVSLASLGWSGSAFYYKITINATSDLSGTPVINDVRLDYVTASSTMLAVDGTTGNVGIGTSSPSQALTVAGSARITGALYGSNNSAGSNGYVLKSTGTGFQWVATSTLGFSSAFTTSAQLASILSDETGSGAAVFGTSPTISGVILGGVTTLSSLTASRALFTDASSRATTTATSAYLLNSLTDETGTGSVVFSAAPTLTATTTVQGSFLVSGTTGGTPASGAGTRMEFIPSKGAFRAGTVGSTEWDASNIGLYSVAFGYGTKATSTYSSAFGDRTIASGIGSFSTGDLQGSTGAITSSGDGSFATGFSTCSGCVYGGQGTIKSSGNGSFAGGSVSGSSFLGSRGDGYVKATGDGSFAYGKASGAYTISTTDTVINAAGVGSVAMGYASPGKTLQASGTAAFALGQDVSTNANNAFALGKGITNSTASTFQVGFSTTTAPTLTVTASNVGIGTSSPSRKLTVAGDGWFGGNLTATGTLSVSGHASFASASTTNLTLAGKFFDVTNSAGTKGYVLQTTATSTHWVATSSLGIGGGATTFLSLTDTPSSYNTGRVLYESGSAVTDSSTFTFANSKLTAPIFNASGASTTIVSLSNQPFLSASSSRYFISLGFDTGTSSGFSNTYANFIGHQAGYSASGASRSNFMGDNAGYEAINANRSNFFGTSAGYTASAADHSNFIGDYAGNAATYAADSNFFGASAGDSATNAYSSNFFGDDAGYTAINAHYSNFFGYLAGNGATNAARSIFIGTRAGDADTVNNASSSASTSIAIGQWSGTGGFSDSIALGHGVINSAVKQLNLGNVLYATGIYSSDSQSATPLSAGKVGIGTSTPSRVLTVAGTGLFTGTLTAPIFNASGASSTIISLNNVPLLSASSTQHFISLGFNTGTTSTGNNDLFLVGYQSGYLAANASESNFIGDRAGYQAANASYSNFIGFFAGHNASSAFDSNFIGDSTGQDAVNADYANFIGSNAGQSATNAEFSNFFGSQAGENATNATNANFFGYGAGYNAARAASSIFIGLNAGKLSTNAARSTFIGTNAGYNDTVNNASSSASTSIAIGQYAGTGGFSDSIALGHGVINSAVKQLNLGNVLYATGIYSSDSQSASPLSGGKIGIGTSSPSQTLTVAGSIRATGALYGSNNSAGSNGYVLKSTGSGFQWVATSTLGIGGGATTFLGLTDTPSSYNTGRVLYESGSAVTDSSTFTFANSMLNVPILNASSSSTTVLALKGQPFMSVDTYNDLITLGLGTGTSTGNNLDSFFVNYQAGYGAARAIESVFIGYQAGYQAVKADTSNFLGNAAGYQATNANESNFLGAYAGYQSINAYSSNFLGNSAGGNANNARYSNFLGIDAGYGATNSGESNFFGDSAGYGATNASSSNFFGQNSGVHAFKAAQSIFIGSNSGNNDTVNNASSSASTSIAIGQWSGTGGFSDSIALGHGVINSAVKQLNLGNVLYATGIYSSDTQSAAALTAGRVGIGTSSPASKLDVWGNLRVGTSSTPTLFANTGNGRVGIGTSSPSQTLTVAGSIRATGALYGSNNSAGSNGYVLKSTGTGFQWVATSTLGLGGGSSQWTTTGSNIYYNTGNVAIGSTSAPYKLYVVNTSTAIPRGILQEQISNDNSAALFGGRHARGSVGALAAVQNNDFLSSFGTQGYDGSSYQTGGFAAFQVAGTVSAGSVPTDYVIYTGNSLGTISEKLRITSGGKIGIGTSTPNTLLTISTSTPSMLTLRNTASGGVPWTFYTGGGGASIPDGSFGIGPGPGTSGSSKLLITSSGNVGIGTTTPNTKLTVATSSPSLLTLRNTSSGGAAWTMYVGNTGTGLPAGSFGIGSGPGISGSSKLVISSSGNVGIGTTSPSVPLHVNGYIRTGVIGGNTGGLQIMSSNGVDWQFTNSSGSDLTLSHNSSFAQNLILNSTNGEQLGIGTTTPQSLITLDKHNLTGSVIAGMKQYFSFTNSTASAVYYGDNTYISNAPTATSTLVGKMIKIKDSTTYGNTVRGLEVQAHLGTNTKGENTALSGYGRTFGVRGTTEGDAGGLYQPAGIFAETRGTTQGNAIRAYSSSITTEDLVSLFQDTSTFAGTGLVMNFGNSGGSFSSTTSKFLDLQNAGVSNFTVGAHGATVIGDGTTNHKAGLSIGYGGLCVDNDGTCNASTTGKITSVSSAVGNSDLAEMYFSSDALVPGDIVSTAGALSIGKANDSTKDSIIGVVSTKPGLTLGFDDTSLTSGQKGYPVALSGRVPIRLSTENGPIKKGDKIALSSIPGVGMKATKTGTVVGIALEDYDGAHAYSEGFINQFGNDITKQKNQPTDVSSDPHLNDGCYHGGGGALGEAQCAPKATSTTATSSTTSLAVDSTAVTLQSLSLEHAQTMTTADGKDVEVGEALMFVNLSWQQSLQETAALADLTSTSTDIVLGGNGHETLLSRLTSLAQGFVNGVLSVFELHANKVVVKDEMCVDDVCVTADDLRALLKNANRPSEGSGNSTVSSSSTNNQQNSGSSNTTATTSQSTSATTTASSRDQADNNAPIIATSTQPTSASSSSANSNVQDQSVTPAPPAQPDTPPADTTLDSTLVNDQSSTPPPDNGTPASTDQTTTP